MGIITLEAFAAAAFGMLVGCVAKDGDAALAIGPPLMTIFILFSGAKIVRAVFFLLFFLSSLVIVLFTPAQKDPSFVRGAASSPDIKPTPHSPPWSRTWECCRSSPPALCSTNDPSPLPFLPLRFANERFRPALVGSAPSPLPARKIRPPRKRSNTRIHGLASR